MWNVSRMIRLKGAIFLWSMPAPFTVNFDDIPDTSSSAIILEEESKKTGKERLRLMFSLSEVGALSPELTSSIQGGFAGLLFGALYGGFVRSRIAYLDFFERNQATAFQSHFEAKRVLQDHVTVNFAKGAFYWGWRLSLFTGSLMLISSSISVYRGKSGIIEYSVAGGVAGGLFRTNLGARGMVVGGLLGTALGTVCGCAIFAMLKATGVTMEDIRDLQSNWYKARLSARDYSVGKALEEDSPAGDLMKLRDKKMEGVSSSFASLPDTTTK